MLIVPEQPIAARSYDVTELVDFVGQPDGSVAIEPKTLPFLYCARAGCPNQATPGYLLCAPCAAARGNV